MRAATDATVLDTGIAVIGAGVVGLSIALRLAQAGHAVTLVAPDDAPEAAASYGNAGLIADYAVLPVGTPEVLRALPSLLFDRDSPLAIRRAALPTLAPWLLRFLRQSMPGAARRNAAAIAALLAPAASEWRALAADIDAGDLLSARGVLHLYRTAAEAQAAHAGRAARAAAGLRLELLTPEELGQLEPALRGAGAAGAAYFPDTLAVSDPGAAVARLAEAVSAAGVARLAGHARNLVRRAAGVEVTVATADGATRLRAGRAVIAAGAHSRPLARAAGDRVPLETERGYHLEFDMAHAPLSRPASPASAGFYLSPMRGRLRVAGTVELGGLHAPPSPHRLAALEAGARRVLPDLPAPDRKWMGFRPSLPDSVPVIGPSRGGDTVLLAFGHGHLGLTLAPITARIITALVDGRTPPVPVTPYLSTRF